MNFYFSVYVKSIDETLFFREFSLLDYKEIQKCIVNNDFNSFNYTITKIINNLCQEKINSEEFTFLERVKIFLIIYSYSVDYIKTFKSYDNKGRKIKKELNIFDIINYFEDNIENKQFEKNEIIFEFGNLNSTYTSNKFELFDFLQSITINNDVYHFFEIDKQLFDDLIDSHTSSDLKDIYEFIKDVIDKNSNKTIFEVFNENGEDISLKIVLDKNHIFKIVTLIIKEDLKDIYELFFNINQSLGISFNDFNLLTQREAKIYIQIFNDKEEKKRRKQKEEESGSKIPNVNF